MRQCSLGLLGASLLMWLVPAALAQEVVNIDNWRVRTGDNPAWSRPGFDDSGWTPTAFPAKTNGATSPWPGGTTWWRATFAVPEEFAGKPLALGMGPLDEVYEVYLEGVSIGTFGHWLPEPQSPNDRHKLFPVPTGILRPGTAHIAIRRWIGGSPSTIGAVNAGFDYGGPSHLPRLGSPALLDAQERLHFVDSLRYGMQNSVPGILLLIAAMVCFAFFSAQRNQWEYLLLGIYCLTVGNAVISMPFALDESVMRRSVGAILLIAWNQSSRTFALLFLAWISKAHRRYLMTTVAISTAIPLLSAWSTLFQTGEWTTAGWLINYFVPGAILLAILGLWRSKDFGGLVIALALLICNLTRSRNVSLWVGSVSWGGIDIAITRLFDSGFAFLTLGILYFRFRGERDRHVAATRDFAAAKLIQESLLQAPGTASWDVKTEYLPVRDVGGDFYQTLPGTDGSLLLVTGDVSGKGLPASLLVAAVVGALGDLASRHPADVLAHLNRALAGKTRGGFVTCCCALFEPGGKVVAANAGHLSPYADGLEVPVNAGLPLGIVGDVEYTEAAFTGNHFTFVSDGVVEAENPQRELFGFERTREISGKSAREIAEAAKAWGQNDDITVVTVRRNV